MQLTPTYGVILIQPLKEETTIDYGTAAKGKIIKGKVIDVGPKMPLDGGLYWERPCSSGDIIYFLHYEGGYDSTFIDGIEYIFAAFKDLRAIEK